MSAPRPGPGGGDGRAGLRGLPPSRWIDLVLVVVLALVAAVLFVPPFGSPIGAQAAACGIGTGAVVALVCAAARLGPAPTLALAALAHVGLAPWILPDVGSGWKAVRAVLAATVTVWRDALTLPVPLTAFPTMTVLPWLAGLATGVLATRAVLSGRVISAGTAVLAQAGVAIAWGVRTALAPSALGAGLMAGVLLLWAMTAQRGRRERVAEVLETRDAGVGRGSRLGLARAVALLAVTAAVAALAIPAAPHSRTVLRDLFEPPLDLTEYATPLSLVRTLETDMASTPLMTASGADESTRIRLAALDSYDGLSARISASATGAARFQRTGHETPLTADGAISSEDSREVTVGIADYSFPWVPTVADTLSLEVSGARAEQVSQSLYYDVFSTTGITTASLSSGDVLTEQVKDPPVASDAQLTEAGIDNVALGPVEDVPPSVQTLATTLVGTTSEPLAQIRMLQQALRTGYYSDGTKSPSPPGHGAARIASMVDAGSLVGDDEQYSVLMMLMCRSLGIPARVVMGFRPTMDGNAANVTGQDVSAWVEVPFRSVGWVTIDVVPDRDQVPQQQTTEKVSNPEPQVLQPPLPLQDPAHLPPSYEDEDRDSSNDDDGRGLGRIVAMVAGGLGAVLLPIATILAAKALRRRRRRRRGGVEGVLGAWDEVVDRARDFGRRTPPRATRREAALSLAPAFPTAELTRFAAAVDGQVFGKGIPTSYAVSTIWASADAMVPSMGSDRSRMRRLAARLSPRSLGRPHRTGSRAARRPITRSRPRRKRS